MPTEIIQSVYQTDTGNEIKGDKPVIHWKKKPLLIGCSGGGGHNAAIIGLYNYLLALNPKQTQLQKYDPLLPINRAHSMHRETIARGIKLMHCSYLGGPIKWFLAATPFPILPTQQELKQEVSSLTQMDERVYIDMLLDVYPAGYESAAIWNSLQKKDQVLELKKLINLQEHSDRENFQRVFEYFLKKLKKAAREGDPYTEVVSTQAMSLPALCEVVNYYNIWLIYKQVKAPKLTIHQYMTDLPTLGAVHFFSPLAKLNQVQQSQMKLYAVDMNKKIIETMLGNHHFAALCNIPANENPMVRPGFKELSFDNSTRFTEGLTLDLQGVELKDIERNEKIAAIMLGSQGSNDTAKYIVPLLQNQISRVFVFGASNEKIKQDIAECINKHPVFINRIISLPNQNDRAIASLMTRCEVLVIRGGGLSVMEQMAMNHHPRQAVFIHHAEPASKEPLSSGIPWEDANVDALIRYLKERGVFCLKTSPARIAQQLEKIKLIHEENQHRQGECKIDLLDDYFGKTSSHFFQYAGEQAKDDALSKEFAYEN